jgi:hypothetical protein
VFQCYHYAKNLHKEGHYLASVPEAGNLQHAALESGRTFMRHLNCQAHFPWQSRTNPEASACHPEQNLSLLRRGIDDETLLVDLPTLFDDPSEISFGLPESCSTSERGNDEDSREGSPETSGRAASPQGEIPSDLVSSNSTLVPVALAELTVQNVETLEKELMYSPTSPAESASEVSNSTRSSHLI